MTPEKCARDLARRLAEHLEQKPLAFLSGSALHIILAALNEHEREVREAVAVDIEDHLDHINLSTQHGVGVADGLDEAADIARGK
jgi:hypothetical protein